MNAKILVDGNNFISHHLKHNKLFAAGKIGVTEGKLLLDFVNKNNFNQASVDEGYINSGIFPKNHFGVNSFCEVYLESIKSLDIAPRWCQCISQFEKRLYETLNPNCYDTDLTHLEPYYFDKPWTDQLDGKKVLVVSPFANLIESQYERFDDIWQGYIKKNFKLTTIKFPFSVGISTDNEMAKHGSYMECLNYYKNLISKHDFDLCILGAGAYALPLCAHCKTMNKSSIHLGGATQILFGILGSRWKDNARIQKRVNSYWKYPPSEYRPTLLNINEGGCYW